MDVQRPFLAVKSVAVTGEVVASTLITATTKETYDDDVPSAAGMPHLATKGLGTWATKARETTDDEPPGKRSPLTAVASNGTDRPFLARFAVRAPGAVRDSTIVTEARGETTDDR